MRDREELLRKINQEQERQLRRSYIVFILAVAVLVLVLLLSPLTSNAENRYTGKYALQHSSHFLIGGLASGLTKHYYPKHWNQDYKLAAEIFAPLLTGLVCETIFDGSNGTWDILDVAEYWAGGGMYLMFSYKF